MFAPAACDDTSRKWQRNDRCESEVRMYRLNHLLRLLGIRCVIHQRQGRVADALGEIDHVSRFAPGDSPLKRPSIPVVAGVMRLED